MDDFGNVVALDRDGELAKRDLRVQELRSETVAEISGELANGVVHHGSKGMRKSYQRSIVPVRLIFFCRSSTP